MSCTLCRLPFTPTNPRVAPPYLELMPEPQYHYLRKAVGIGARVPFTMLNCHYFDGQYFNVRLKAFPLTVGWKSGEGTMMMFHVVCARILRHIFGCTAKTMEAMYSLCEIEKVLGPTMLDVNSGRLRHVRYEEAGEKVDVRPYYELEEDFARFDWARFKQDGFEWTYTRPDTFPRFHQTVSPRRIPGPVPAETHDMLTTKPLDILHAVLPYLTDKSLVSLLSTCRTLRHHALTAFQFQARGRVLAHGWAIPLHNEYESAPQAARDAGVMVNPGNIPLKGDWMLYLCNVHRSKSMRARRWIWATAEELHRAFLEHRAGSPYEETVEGEGPDARRVKSRGRVELEAEVARYPFNVVSLPHW